MMRRPVLALVAAVGCGRLEFEPTAPADAAWSDDFTITDPVAQALINSTSYETECAFLPDGLTLYFATDRMFDPGQHDVYAATRASLDADFANPVVLASISSPEEEGRLITADGLVAYYWSNRDLSGIDTDIWTVTRADTTVPFAGASAVLVPSLASPEYEYDPWPTPDGRRVYAVFIDSAVRQDLVVVERESPSAELGPPQPLANVNSPMDDDNPALSGDERFLVFSSNRGGNRDLYYSRRADRDAAFEPPRPLPVVNTSYDEWEPCITDRGELVFSSDRPGGLGGHDLYRARFVPLP